MRVFHQMLQDEWWITLLLLCLVYRGPYLANSSYISYDIGVYLTESRQSMLICFSMYIKPNREKKGHFRTFLILEFHNFPPLYK